MKKVFLMMAISALTMIGFQSCEKEEIEKAAISQTITVQLKTNESYTFVLTKNKRDDEYRFTTQAQHASISTLGVDANGNRIYQYTPASNYVGNDQVVVSNDWERTEEHDQQGPPPPMGPHNGNCSGGQHLGNDDGGEEDHYIVTINFVMSKDALTSKY